MSQIEEFPTEPDRDPSPPDGPVPMGDPAEPQVDPGDVREPSDDPVPIEPDPEEGNRELPDDIEHA